MVLVAQGLEGGKTRFYVLHYPLAPSADDPALLIGLGFSKVREAGGVV